MGSVSNSSSWKGARGTILPLMLPCWQRGSSRMEGELLAEPSLCSNSASALYPRESCLETSIPCGSNKTYVNSTGRAHKGKGAGEGIKTNHFQSCTLKIICISNNAFFGTCVQQSLHWCLWEYGWMLLAKFASIFSLAIAILDEGNEKSDPF